MTDLEPHIRARWTTRCLVCGRARIDERTHYEGVEEAAPAIPRECSRCGHGLRGDPVSYLQQFEILEVVES